MDEISIHALLAESDATDKSGRSDFYNFYPRSPCGERLSVVFLLLGAGVFLSTLSLRRATASTRIDTDNNSDFYPRSPCGERPTMAGVGTTTSPFLSTLSLRRATALHRRKSLYQGFLSTLSLRRATCGNAGIGSPITISIHALLAESDQDQ